MMKHSKRAIAPVALGLAAALTLAGCSSSAAPAPTETTGGGELTVWFPGSSETEIDLVTNTLVPEFEKQTGATVEVTFVDWGDLGPKLSAAFAAGTGPDVFGHGPAAAADLVANDRVLDLTPYVESLSAEDQEDLQASLVGGQVDGTQYLIPLSIGGQLIAYRGDLLDEAGIDPADITTWDDLRDAAEKLTVKDGSTITRSGVLLGSAPIQRIQTFNALLSGDGGTLMAEDGSAAEFDSDAGVDALTYFADLYNGEDAVAANAGVDVINAPTADNPLATGAAAMALLTSQAASQVAAANPDAEIGILPALKGSKKQAAFGGAGAGLFINADTADKDLSWEFIEFMSSADISTAYAEGTSTIPIRASAIDSDYISDNPIVAAFLAQVPNFVPNPNVPLWVQVRDVLDAQLEAALLAASTPEAALEQAASEADAIVGG